MKIDARDSDGVGIVVKEDLELCWYDDGKQFGFYVSEKHLRYLFGKLLEHFLDFQKGEK